MILSNCTTCANISPSMLETPANSPSPPSSQHLRQQKRSRPRPRPRPVHYQTTTAVMQHRERELEKEREKERLEGRMSPTPFADMLRPVSPFRGERRVLAHQQPQLNAPMYPYSSNYQTPSQPQYYSQAHPSSERRVQETPNNYHSNVRSNTLPNANTNVREGGIQSTNKDSDISPALRMMTYNESRATGSTQRYETWSPPASSREDDRSALSHSSRETHSQSHAHDNKRAMSPQSSKGKHGPGYRKPVPKFEPTPPSTPSTPAPPPLPPVSVPTAVPPIQLPVHPTPVKAHSHPVPQSNASQMRPPRAETGDHIPPMFRDQTVRIAEGNLELSKGKITHGQQTHAQNVHMVNQYKPLVVERPDRPERVQPVHTQPFQPALLVQTPPVQPQIRQQAPPPSQPTSSQPTTQSMQVTQPHPQPIVPPRYQAISSPQVELQAPAPAHTAFHSYPQPSMETAPSIPRLAETKLDQQRTVIAHPQPKKMPSVSQLVAIACRIRTPSPMLLPSEDDPVTFPTRQAQPPAQSQIQTSVSDQQLPAVAKVSRTPSPFVPFTENVSNPPPKAESPDHLQAYQVSLPSSKGSSAKSSRSPSPHLQVSPEVLINMQQLTISQTPQVQNQGVRPFRTPSPLVISETDHSSQAHPTPANYPSQASIPVRPLSPTPMIPQYAPPRPPFPPPPPNTPVLAPRPRSAVHSQFLPSNLIQQSTVVDRHVRPRSPEIVSVIPPPPPPPAPIKAVTPPIVECEPLPTRPSAQTTMERELTSSHGLLTPPETPPGTASSHSDKKIDEADRVYSPSPNSPVALTARFHGSATLQLPTEHERVKQAVPSSTVFALSSSRDYALNNDDLAAEALSVPRPAAPAPAVMPPAPPPTPANATTREAMTPPMPSDWRDVIYRVVRASVNQDALRALPIQFDEDSSMLPPMKNPVLVQNLEVPNAPPTTVLAEVVITEDPDRASRKSASIIDRSSVRELGDRETSHAAQPAKVDLQLAHNDEKPQGVLISPRPLPEVLSTPLDVSSSRVEAGAQSHSDSTSRAQPVESQVTHFPSPPPRSRSPNQRKRAHQHSIASGNLYRPRDDRSEDMLVTNTAPVTGTPSPDPSSVPLSVAPPEVPPRIHPAVPRKKERALHHRPNEKKSAPYTHNESQEPGERASQSQLVDAPLSLVPQAPIRPSSPVPLPQRTISPPPRNQSLGEWKLMSPASTVAGLDRQTGESLDQAAYQTTVPSSVPSSPHAFSPQPLHPPAKTSRGHMHGHNKRAAATEEYRPPTPPHSTHYRKKRSNDVLPSEPFASFMKPAMHVIYPDTSTSDGHSLSGKSALGMSQLRNAAPTPSFDSTHNTSTNFTVSKRNPPNSYMYADKEERDLPRSPASSSESLGIELEYDDDEHEPTAFASPSSRSSHLNHSRTGFDNGSYSDVTIQHATKGYRSKPIGPSRAHTLVLPPSNSGVRGHNKGHRNDTHSRSSQSAHRARQAHAKRAMRSMSEKVVRDSYTEPISRSRSSPLPSSRQRPRKSFWKIFGIWVKLFMKFKTWKSPTSSPEPSPTTRRRRSYNYDR